MENVFETITYTIRLWNKNEAEAVYVNAEHPNKQVPGCINFSF